jgi:hypothetical protein
MRSWCPAHGGLAAETKDRQPSPQGWSKFCDQRGTEDAAGSTGPANVDVPTDSGGTIFCALLKCRCTFATSRGCSANRFLLPWRRIVPGPS